MGLIWVVSSGRSEPLFQSMSTANVRAPQNTSFGTPVCRRESAPTGEVPFHPMKTLDERSSELARHSDEKFIDL